MPIWSLLGTVADQADEQSEQSLVDQTKSGMAKKYVVDFIVRRDFRLLISTELK